MDFLQQAPPLALAVLALIDATSIGTLVIPIWLLLRGDHRSAVPKVVLYLAAIAAFYWLVGAGLRAGWQVGQLAGAGRYLDLPLVRWVQLLLGAGMVLWALTAKPGGKDHASAGPGRSMRAHVNIDADTDADDGPRAALTVPRRLTGRLDAALDSRGAVVALALLAGLLELPTMLPYLGVLGLMEHLGWSAPTQLTALGGYCLVMILPALGLAGLRRASGARIDRWLQHAGRRLSRYTAETLAWVVGIAGVLLVRSAGQHLQLGGWLPFG